MDVIMLKYPAGEMTIDFRTYLKYHRYGKTYVKRLLALSSSETRAKMPNTVETLMDETRAECAKVMNDYEKQITDINNKYLFEYEREKAKQPVRKKCAARRKALNGQFEKLMKIRGLIENE